MLLAGPIILMGSVLERIIDTWEAVMKDGTQREIRQAGRDDREKERRGKVTLPPLFPPPIIHPFLRHHNVALTGLLRTGHARKSALLPLSSSHVCSAPGYQLQMNRSCF